MAATRSAEHREKIREALRGRPKTPEHREKIGHSLRQYWQRVKGALDEEGGQ